jgi:hypothetical protein
MEAIIVLDRISVPVTNINGCNKHRTSLFHLWYLHVLCMLNHGICIIIVFHSIHSFRGSIVKDTSDAEHSGYGVLMYPWSLAYLIHCRHRPRLQSAILSQLRVPLTKCLGLAIPSFRMLWRVYKRWSSGIQGRREALSGRRKQLYPSSAHLQILLDSPHALRRKGSSLRFPLMMHRHLDKPSLSLMIHRPFPTWMNKSTIFQMLHLRTAGLQWLYVSYFCNMDTALIMQSCVDSNGTVGSPPEKVSPNPAGDGGSASIQQVLHMCQTCGVQVSGLLLCTTILQGLLSESTYEFPVSSAIAMDRNTLFFSIPTINRVFSLPWA